MTIAKVCKRLESIVDDEGLYLVIEGLIAYCSDRAMDFDEMNRPDFSARWTAAADKLMQTVESHPIQDLMCRKE